MIPRACAVLVVLGGLAVACGCGSSEPVVRTSSQQEVMDEVAAMYKAYTADRKAAPRKLSDFDERYEPAYQVGYMALRDGNVVMLFGGPAPGADAGERVVAYEKQAPDQGGLVAFQDGTVKQMAAAEFQSAKKVGK